VEAAGVRVGWLGRRRAQGGGGQQPHLQVGRRPLEEVRAEAGVAAPPLLGGELVADDRPLEVREVVRERLAHARRLVDGRRAEARAQLLQHRVLGGHVVGHVLLDAQPRAAHRRVVGAQRLDHLAQLPRLHRVAPVHALAVVRRVVEDRAHRRAARLVHVPIDDDAGRWLRRAEKGEDQERHRLAVAQVA